MHAVEFQATQNLERERPHPDAGHCRVVLTGTGTGRSQSIKTGPCSRKCRRAPAAPVRRLSPHSVQSYGAPLWRLSNGLAACPPPHTHPTGAACIGEVPVPHSARTWNGGEGRHWIAFKNVRSIRVTDTPTRTWPHREGISQRNSIYGAEFVVFVSVWSNHGILAKIAIGLDPQQPSCTSLWWLQWNRQAFSMQKRRTIWLTNSRRPSPRYCPVRPWREFVVWLVTLRWQLSAEPGLTSAADAISLQWDGITISETAGLREPGSLFMLMNGRLNPEWQNCINALARCE